MRRSKPFGQPNIDNWLHWVIPPRPGNTVAVRYRGEWYVVGTGLYGWFVEHLAQKNADTLFVSLPTVEYAALPALFQLDVDKWRELLFARITGVKNGKETKGITARQKT